MIELTDKGLFCPQGSFHIDPCRGVDVAVITHAHSDHARKGSGTYYCALSSVRLLKRRLGDKAKIIGVPYREKFKLGTVTVSLHPAGHMLGSAQVRVEGQWEGRTQVWVASGDYKRAPDPTCEPFEVIECDTFITEATFGNPRYCWNELLDAAAEIHNWWEANRKRGVNSLLFCYSMGKAQRVLASLAELVNDPIHIYGETVELTEIYKLEGIRLAQFIDLERRAANELKGELIVAPHSFSRATHPLHGVSWMQTLEPFETGFASGWMQTGAFGVYSRYDRGFVLSDHADFPALVRTIQETGARRVFVLHAQEGKALIRHLCGLGIMASAMEKPSPQGELFRSSQLGLFD